MSTGLEIRRGESAILQGGQCRDISGCETAQRVERWGRFQDVFPPGERENFRDDQPVVALLAQKHHELGLRPDCVCGMLWTPQLGSKAWMGRPV